MKKYKMLTFENEEMLSVTFIKLLNFVISGKPFFIIRIQRCFLQTTKTCYK